MTTHVLIISTSENTAWFDYLDSLSNEKFNFSLLTNNQVQENIFKTKNWKNNRFTKFINTDNKYLFILFLILKPLFCLHAFFIILYYKLSKKINTIVCLGSFEKLHFTRVAKLLNINVVWIMHPGTQDSISKINKACFRRLSKSAKLICLDKKCVEILTSNPFKFKNVSHIRIGMKDKQSQDQKNIFDSLAKNKTNSKQKNFFTIGTIQDLDGDIGPLERLLHATKNCLSIIPDIQLIIAGDGVGRKKLTWMAKKMDISNLVWFVGNDRKAQKWLSNFDIFISTNESPTLNDLNILLLAQASGLTVIAPKGVGFSEFINKNTGILVDKDKNQDLSDAIIRLQQDPEKRKQLGKNAQKNLQENFKLSDTIKQFAEILR